MSARWRDEHRRDPYARKARSEGYRSRSAYKLLQIQERFGLIRKDDAVLDVGCHPGGWSQVASELVGEDGDIIGIDLKYTSPLPSCRFYEMDAADPGAPETLLTLFGRPVNTVISDISPNLTGRYEMDVVNSVHLSVIALDLALHLLCDGVDHISNLWSSFRVMNRILDLARSPATIIIFEGIPFRLRTLVDVINISSLEAFNHFRNIR